MTTSSFSNVCRCGAPLAPSARRPRKYCSDACRWRAWDARHPRVDALPEHERRDTPAWQAGAADCECNNADDAFCSCQGECPCHDTLLWRDS